MMSETLYWNVGVLTAHVAKHKKLILESGSSLVECQTRNRESEV